MAGRRGASPEDSGRPGRAGDRSGGGGAVMTAHDKARFIAGIDLGTTNSALGFVDKQGLSDEKPISASVLDVPQLASPGNVLPRSMLPSFMYIAEAGEFPPGQLDLPWAKERAFM